MNETLNQLASYNVPGIYDTPEFLQVLEDHIEYFKKRDNTLVVMVEEHIGNKYKFDLYGLFAHYGVPSTLMWLTMRMNSFRSPLQYTGRAGHMLVPDQTDVTHIAQTFMTQAKKIF